MFLEGGVQGAGDISVSTLCRCFPLHRYHGFAYSSWFGAPRLISFFLNLSEKKWCLEVTAEVAKTARNDD